VQSLLQQLAKRRRPGIPAVLQNRQGQPRLPPFLDLLHTVECASPTLTRSSSSSGALPAGRPILSNGGRHGRPGLAGR
jgi:hypothetical protein